MCRRCRYPTSLHPSYLLGRQLCIPEETFSGFQPVQPTACRGRDRQQAVFHCHNTTTLIPVGHLKMSTKTS